MERDDEMLIHQLMDEEDAFDTDVQEYLLISFVLKECMLPSRKMAMLFRLYTWEK
jgi:hypothetical protein